ncbi:MAG: PfkB family carbohydrate kinase, partial [Solimonas sp.]
MIIVFGSLNLDLIAYVDALPQPGQTVPARSFRSEPGGKGGNQALAAARDGAAVAMVGAIGDDAFAVDMLGHLRAAGVDLQRVARVAGASGCALIAADRHGRNSIIVNAGANATVRAAQLPDALLGPATTLLLQMETPADENADLIRRARARAARIVLNLAPATALPDTALRMLDWLVVNEAEAEWLAAAHGVEASAAALHAGFGTGVVRTLGAAGVEAAWRGGR